MRYAATLSAFLVIAGAANAQTPNNGNVVLPPNVRYTCNQPVNIDLLKVNLTTLNQDAVSLAPGCVGRIGRVEVDTSTLDGIKCQNPTSGHVHDLVIESGYIATHGFSSGAHQDLVQCMGGERVTFRNMLFSSAPGTPGGGAFFVAHGGTNSAHDPTDV